MSRRFMKKAALSFILPVLCLCALLAFMNIYPFGEFSNMHSDMHIQYVDFFAYFKDVLEGKASAEYSFSSTLGASVTALVGYYLLSPFNLLVVFFEKSQLQLFFFVITALKTGCCGLAFSFLLEKRFSLSALHTALLSTAYAFTQYVAGQMTNIMWLDGVMMLPVMMAGVYSYIEKDRTLLLYLSVALSIIFNWYTAYINCLFIVLYYLFETACRPFSLQKECRKFFRFLFVEALGVLLSCMVFLPVVLNQMQGRTVEYSLSFSNLLNGEWWDIAFAFMIGSPFPSKQITFFCSVWALLFFFAFFFSHAIGKAEKRAGLLLIVILYLSFLLKPLEFIWSGFLRVGSYAYRYMYIAGACVLLLAARSAKAQETAPVCSAVFSKLMACAVLGILTILTFHVRECDQKLLYLQLGLIGIYLFGFLFRCWIGCRSRKGAFLPKLDRVILPLCTVLIFCIEIFINACCVTDQMYLHSAQEYIDYSMNQQALIDSIQKQDPSVYRMEQTLNRDRNEDHHSFYANESLAYGYRGLQTYTSCYDDSTADILLRFGYNTSYFPSFYHDPLLAADSFLGVKYLLSEKSYTGYQPLDLESRNGKSVYLNPYALPLAFAAQTTDASAISSSPFGANENPFEYVNELYSAVLGQATPLYRRLSYTQIQEENGRMCFVHDQADIPHHAPVYFVLLGDDLYNTVLTVNGVSQPYNQYTWAEADYAVCLGDAGDLKEVRCENGRCDEILLYYLDLDLLARACEQIRTKQAQNIQLEQNWIKVDYEADCDGMLLLTIPYIKGWTAAVNGTAVTVQKALQNFMAVPVQAGRNQITLAYSSPGKGVGLALSLLSVSGYLLLCSYSKKKSTANAI